jgi:hypothetical protein
VAFDRLVVRGASSLYKQKHIFVPLMITQNR